MDERWHTSSYSSNHGGNCLEAAELPKLVKLRDTQNRERGCLSFSVSEWSAFLSDVRNGEL